MKRSLKSDAGEELRQRIIRLRAERRARKLGNRSRTRPRSSLSQRQRDEIFAKTAGHCHICGGYIGSERWQADHVLAHSGGGEHRLDNYLPAHALCNNYRWDYLSEEFQLIMKLGVYAKTQIERDTPLGLTIREAFCRYELQRAARRKNPDRETAT